MCPNSQDPSRLTATSVMSYKAVTASKPKQLPEAPRKGTAYRATKKLDKNNNDWHINNEHYNITHKFNQFTNNSTLITHNNTHHLTNTTHTTTNTNINTITKDIKDITVIEGEGANTKETPFGGTLGPSTVMEDKDFSLYSFNSNYSVTGSGPTNSTTVVPNTTTNSTNDSTIVPGTNGGTVGPSTVTEGKGANSMPMECTNSSINTKDFGDTIKEQNMYMNIRDHAVLTEEELATFRTSFCTKHHQNKCPNSDSCEKSHCLTWQRRNPYEISYCPHLCPNIQFVKKSRKMVLYRRCTRGKNCNFAHSKEEELYHPLVYKTKQCSSYPKCSRYFCPFIHEPHELRDISRFKNSSVTVTGTTATCSTMTGTTGPTDTIPPPKVTTTPGKGANFTGTECTGSTKEAPFGAGTLGTTGAVGPSTVTEEEKEKVEMIETSFEFDCLDTINGQDTFRDGFTNNSFESNSTKDNLDHLIKSPNKSNIWDKNEEMENVMWYDLPNLNMNVYDDSLKPLYEPFNSYYSSINPYNTTINPYNTTINPYINIPNTIPNNSIISNNMNIGMDIGYTYENYHDEQYYTNYPNLSSTINNKNKKKISSSVTVTGPPNSNGPDSNSSTRVTGNSSNDSKDTGTVGPSTFTKDITTNKGIKGTKDINTKDTTNTKNTNGSSNDSSPKGAVGASTVTDTVTEENYYSYDYYKSYNNYQLKEFPDYKPYTEDYKGYTEDYKGYTEDYKGYTEEYKPYTEDYKGYTEDYKGYREEYGFVDNMGFVDNIGFVEDYKGYYDYETYQMDSNYSMNQMNPMDPVNSMNQMESNYSNNYSYDFGTDYVQYNTQELDEQFNNLNVKDDYSFNDMLVKFINEIGDK